jgi:hypothetical protein
MPLEFRQWNIEIGLKARPMPGNAHGAAVGISRATKDLKCPNPMPNRSAAHAPE